MIRLDLENASIDETNNIYIPIIVLQNQHYALNKEEWSRIFYESFSKKNTFKEEISKITDKRFDISVYGNGNFQIVFEVTNINDVNENFLLYLLERVKEHEVISNEKIKDNTAFRLEVSNKIKELSKLKSLSLLQ